MKITNCSLGCMYAEGPLSKCQCACGGSMHALMVNRPVAAQCSRNMGNRCKEGREEGECTCACGGANHGLYHTIEDFGSVRITGMAHAH